MTTKGFDDLLDFLLDEVAFRGYQGASITDFSHLIDAFYQDSDENVSRESNEPHAIDPGGATTDRELQRRIWAWLTGHPDISVGHNGEQKGVSYDEAVIHSSTDRQARAISACNSENVLEPVPLQNSAPPSQSRNAHQHLSSNSSITPNENGAQCEDPSEDTSAEDRSRSIRTLEPTTDSIDDPNASHSANHPSHEGVRHSGRDELRIYASEDRVWRAIAGHDVDWRRLPRMEMDLLSIIAGSGPRGILQSALVQASRQDKRSVPHRTDRLHANGYINKNRVMANHAHTSMCVHKRFAKTDHKKDQGYDANESERRAIFMDGVVLYEPLFKSVFSLLRAHNNIMTLMNLRQCLGFPPKIAQSRLFYRMATKLEKLGCLQRVMVKATNSDSPDRRFRCLKILREPTDDDLRKFVSFGKREDKPGQEYSQEIESSQDLDDLFAVDDESDVRRTPPQWTPDIPHANFIYNLIDTGGLQGLASKDIRLRAVGVFWRRSMDVSLGRLSDAWDLSQPPHLRHLAVIRDTIQISKSTQYIYRTYPNFQKAVNAGQAEWEAVVSRVASSAHKKGSNKVLHATEPNLDELGFLFIPDKQFVSSQGSATLSECEDRAKIKKQNSKPSDPGLKILEDDKLGLNWDSRGSFKKSRYWRSKDVLKILPGLRPTSLKKGRGRIAKSDSERIRKANAPIKRKQAGAEGNVSETTHEREDDYFEAGAAERRMPAKRKSRGLSLKGRKSPTKRARVGEHLGNSASIPSAQSEAVGNETVDSTPQMDCQNSAQIISSPNEGERKSRLRVGRKRKISELDDHPPIDDQSNRLVRINPPGSEKPLKQPRRGRRPKSLIVVITSDYIRRPNWLENGEMRNSVDDPSLDTNGLPRGELRLATPLRQSDIDTPVTDGNPQLPAENTDISIVSLSNVGLQPIQHTANENRSCSMEETHGPDGSQDGLPIEKENFVSVQSPEKSISGQINTPGTPSNDSTSLSAKLTAPEEFDQSRASKGKIEQARIQTSTTPRTRRKQNSGPVNHSTNEEATSLGQLIGDLEPTEPAPRERVEPVGTRVAEDDSGVGRQIFEREDPTDSGRNDHIRQAIDPDLWSATVERHQFNKDSEPKKDDTPKQPELYGTHIGGSHEQNDSLDQRRLASTGNTISATYSARKRGVVISGGFVGLSRAKTVIRIIEQAGGVFPGGNAMWYPFMTAWGDNKDGTRTDRKTLHRVVRNLVEQGKLHKLTFVFKDATGAIVTRYLLTLPNENPESEKVRETQKRISDAHPFQYLPPGVHVSDKLKESMKRTLRASFEPGERINFLTRVQSQARTVSMDNSMPNAGETTENLVEYTPEERQRSQPTGTSDVTIEVVANPSKPLNERFLTDDSVTVDLLFQPPESATTPVPKVSRASSNRASKQTKGTKRIRNASAISGHLSTPESGLEHDTGLSRRSIDRSHLRQMSRTNTAISTDKSKDTGLIFINKFPESYDPDYELTRVFTIMDPDQGFYPNIGSFSTESSVTRNARLELWMNLDTQEAFEKAMPYNVHDIVLSATKLSKTSKAVENFIDPGSERLSHELSLTRKWEESIISDKEWQHNYSDRKLKSVRFINHFVPDEQSAESGAMLVDWISPESEHVTSTEHRVAPRNASNARANFNPSFITSETSKSGPIIDHNQEELGFVWQDYYFSSVAGPWQYDAQYLNPSRLSQSSQQAVHGIQGILVPQHEPKKKTPISRSRARRSKYELWERSTQGQSRNAPQDPSLPPPPSSSAKDSGVVRGPSVSLDTVERKTLMLAVAIVRSLTSGNDQREIQWGLVAQACGYMYDGLQLRKYWTSCQQKSKTFTDELQKDFQTRFLIAYENGELPNLDYHNLEEFDWAWLLDWARDACAHKPKQRVHRKNLEQLPSGGRDMLKLDYSLSKSDEHPHFTERFFNIIASAPYRDALLNRSAFLSPIKVNDKGCPREPNLQSRYMPTSDLQIARSWIRANCLTPSTSFDGHSASAKLRKLTEKTIDNALEAMISDKVLRPLKKDRTLPGRNYDLTDLFLNSFRRPLELKHFREAAGFKQQLDLAFQNYDPENADDASAQNSKLGITISPLAAEGEVVAVLNLIATGCIKLDPKLPPITDDVDAASSNISKWGFTAPAYQTAQMDRKKLHFDLEVLPTSAYVFGNPIRERITARQIRTPPVPDSASENAPIPVWCDINGDCIPETWNMVLVAILMTLVIRSGAGVDTIVDCCKGSVEGWEVLLCLEWCEAVGALQQIGSGWTTDDWWWLAIVDNLDGQVNS